jgi:hypothetical protein
MTLAHGLTDYDDFALKLGLMKDRICGLLGITREVAAVDAVAPANPTTTNAASGTHPTTENTQNRKM